MSKTFGVEEEKVTQALRQTIPLAVHSLLELGKQNGSTDVVGHLAREAAAAGLPENTEVLHTTDWAARCSALMHEALGPAYGMTLHCLSAATGIRPVENTTILGYTLAFALGALGNYANQRQLTDFELLHWVQAQEGEILQAVPAYSRVPATQQVVKQAPLALDTLPDTRPVGQPLELAAQSAVISRRGFAAQAPFGKAMQDKPQHLLHWQLAGLLAVAIGLGYVIGHDDSEPPITKAEAESPASTVALISPAEPPVTPPAPAATTSTAPATALAPGRYDPTTDTFIYDTGPPTTLQLAGGTTLRTGANSTESQLYRFLSNPAMQVDSVNRTKGWINCDRIYFEPSQAILTEGSGEQLRNIASILRAFPTARIKFGGYTDSTGNPLKNFQLSESRAKAAMLALSSIGIDINRIESKGYGGKFFLTTNTTPEGRAMNRRVSLRVIKK
ncbi:OmpA family protein [Hymenobacter fodinae]|uniref:OmpA family protein n=1 Tax=Hymenobacter fodinae TaxID=2510796 RepID=UPI001436AA70|nr:OmpA family protein [Hymenobacter fodinae]